MRLDHQTRAFPELIQNSWNGPCGRKQSFKNPNNRSPHC